MKLLLSTATLLVLVVLVTPSLRAQSYGLYYDPYWDIHYQQYLQWQQYLQYLQQNDPYYELHVVHYQLYLQPYQPYQMSQTCCYSFGVPAWSATPRRRLPAAPLPTGQIGLEEGNPRARVAGAWVHAPVEHFAEAQNPIIDPCVTSHQRRSGSAFSGAITISIDSNDTYSITEIVGRSFFRSPWSSVAFAIQSNRSLEAFGLPTQYKIY